LIGIEELFYVTQASNKKKAPVAIADIPSMAPSMEKDEELL